MLRLQAGVAQKDKLSKIEDRVPQKRSENSIDEEGNCIFQLAVIDDDESFPVSGLSQIIIEIIRPIESGS